MSKWKWIAQDENGSIYKFDIEPKMYDDWGFLNVHNRGLKIIKEGKPNPNFKDTLINIETEDYDINDGILTRIPRKTHLDKLIANVKKIDKKAAKWMTKNRHKLRDTDDLTGCFHWDDYEEFEWCDIYVELLDLETEQEPAKGILKYRVGLYIDNGRKNLGFSTNVEHEYLIERNPDFSRWLTDWIEVEV
jgi:hypothetical protein